LEPSPISAPGCPDAFEYTATLIVDARLVASRYKLAELGVPEADATNGNASPSPAGLVLTLDSTGWSPSSTGDGELAAALQVLRT
jgi:hypothetical protein